MSVIPTSQLDVSTLNEIRKLHFQTRRLATQGILGSYRSAFRGRGIEFEEVRSYHPGDDVRTIDWKVTARQGQPFIKSYREERELNVIIAVDVSASCRTGTREQLKESLIAKVGAVLSLIALNNNDKVGLVTYSDKLETYHPPRKTRSAVWRILHEVLNPKPRSRGTDLAGLFTFLLSVLKRHSILFVVSDFIDTGFESPLAALAKKHDVTAIVIHDPTDRALPKTHMLRVHDPEGGEVRVLETRHTATQSDYRAISSRQLKALYSLLRKNQVGQINLHTNSPFMSELRKYFTRKHTAKLNL